MFGIFGKKKASTKLANAIRGLEASYVKNAPKEFIRIGLENFEIPARPVYKSNTK